MHAVENRLQLRNKNTRELFDILVLFLLFSKLS